MATDVKLTGFDHIVLAVRDIDRTLAFYEQFLGMERVQERPGKWALRFGAHKISLQKADDMPAIAAGTLPGSGNFCVLAETPVDVLAGNLKAEGIDVLAHGDRTGATGPIRSVYFNDPDGNLVEVSNRI